MKAPSTILLATLALSPLCGADEGDLIGNVNLPVTGNGVSLAVDCDGNVYYTNNGQFALHVMDETGALITSLPTTDVATGAPLDFDEMAYDNGRGVLWAQLHGSNPISIYHVDPATGDATFQWNSATISIGTFRDGIAYDASDDTIWLSGDVSDTVDHYTAGGAFINTITPTNAAGGTLGLISGLSIGVGDLLYLGRNGAVEIVQVQKSDGSFIESFASPGGARDEGLECDPVNFFPTLALWSREFFAPGFASVIELEPGTCACAGQQNSPPVITLDGAECGSTAMATADVAFCFDVTAQDIDPGDTVTLVAITLPPGATLNPGLPQQGNPVSSTFCWTPTIGQTGQCFDATFMAVDDEGRNTTCTVEICASECYLLLGPWKGSANELIGSHVFPTQLEDVNAFHPVTLDDYPYFDVDSVAGGPVRGEFRYVAAQVVMWNQTTFPTDPERYTGGALVKIAADGTVTWTPYGSAHNMHISVVVDTDPVTGEDRFSFPFTIDF